MMQIQNRETTLDELNKLAAGGGYVFNLVVKTFPPGGYTLDFTATGDPATHHAPFTVK